MAKTEAELKAEREAEEQRQREQAAAQKSEGSGFWDFLGRFMPDFSFFGICIGLAMLCGAYFLGRTETGKEALGKLFGAEGVGKFFDGGDAMLARLFKIDISSTLEGATNDERRAKIAKQMGEEAANVLAADKPTSDRLIALVKRVNGNKILVDDFTNDKTLFALLTEEAPMVRKLVTSLKLGEAKSDNAGATAIRESLKKIVSDERLDTLLGPTHRANTIALLKTMASASSITLDDATLNGILAAGMVNGKASQDLRNFLNGAIDGNISAALGGSASTTTDSASANPAAPGAAPATNNPVAQAVADAFLPSKLIAHMTPEFVAGMSEGAGKTLVTNVQQKPAAGAALDGYVKALGDGDVAAGMAKLTPLMDALKPGATANPAEMQKSLMNIVLAPENIYALPVALDLVAEVPALLPTMPVPPAALKSFIGATAVTKDGAPNAAFTTLIEGMHTAATSETGLTKEAMQPLVMNYVLSPDVAHNPKAVAAAFDLAAHVPTLLPPMPVPPAALKAFIDATAVTKDGTINTAFTTLIAGMRTAATSETGLTSAAMQPLVMNYVLSPEVANNPKTVAATKALLQSLDKSQFTGRDAAGNPSKLTPALYAQAVTLHTQITPERLKVASAINANGVNPLDLMTAFSATVKGKTDIVAPDTALKKLLRPDINALVAKAGPENFAPLATSPLLSPQNLKAIVTFTGEIGRDPANMAKDKPHLPNQRTFAVLDAIRKLVVPPVVSPAEAFKGITAETLSGFFAVPANHNALVHLLRGIDRSHLDRCAIEKIDALLGTLGNHQRGLTSVLKTRDGAKFFLDQIDTPKDGILQQTYNKFGQPTWMANAALFLEGGAISDNRAILIRLGKLLGQHEKTCAAPSPVPLFDASKTNANQAPARP